MAQGGMKTLLVGSDLRKPGIDRAFGVDRSPGLTNVLMDEHSWRETVKTVTDILLEKMSWDEIMLTPGLDNLHFITSGTPPQNPAELIDSKRLEEFIEAAKKEYDVIIFDSSPILSTADAAILGMKVDGVLLVYRVGSISKGLLKRTASQLEQVQCNLMGVIINGMKPDISPDFQGYKYYSYYYSYGESENQKTDKLKKQRVTKPVMMIAAVACLALGFLWQSGLIASLNRSLLGTPDKTVARETSTDGLLKPTKESGKPTKTLKIAPKGKVKKMPMPRRPAETTLDAKSFNPDLPKPGPLSIKKEGNQENGKVDKQKSPASGANVEENHSQDVAGSIPDWAAPEEPPVEKSAKIHGPSPVKASLTDLKKPAVPEKPPNDPYTLQLGSFRTLTQAKNAVTQYREKGLSAFWSEVNLDGNARWFRVFTGSFETREHAKKYREKKNLHKSLVTRMPKAVTPEGKRTVEPAPSEQALAAQAQQTKMSPVGMPEDTTPAKQAPTEYALAEQAQLEMSTNGTEALSHPKKLEIHEEYPRYPYSIQLGSYISVENAKKTVATYREKGLPAYWCKVDLEKNGKWFKVYTGFFENREQAKKYQQEENLVPSVVKKTPYTTFVGIFRDKEHIEKKSLSLEKLGYLPYSIRGVSGTYRLFVGTFPNEKSAELLKRDLESKGIENHVIHR
jgi:capsular exopolysaccharide synthesis family protein